MPHISDPEVDILTLHEGDTKAIRESLDIRALLIRKLDESHMTETGELIVTYTSDEVERLKQWLTSSSKNE